MGETSRSWSEEPTLVAGGRPQRPSALARGSLLGRYVVLEELGAGGMGTVFAAHDPELDRKVAIKVLNEPLGHVSRERRHEGRMRLLREAQALARLAHPNVVGVHDVGIHEGRVFVAMEYVDGVTLRTWQRARARGWREIIDMYLEAARGLAAAHAAGLVHRDFKPENVMLGDYRVVRRTALAT